MKNGKLNRGSRSFFGKQPLRGREAQQLTRWFVVFVLVIQVDPLVAQLHLNPKSRLMDSLYVERSIKSISHEELFSALDLSSKRFDGVQGAAKKGDFPLAYQMWAQYWDMKQQPKYITQNYHMLIDTDMLTDYDNFRSYVGKYPEERDTILNRAEMLLKHRIPAWGDIVLEFGPVVDFNRNVGQSGKYGFHYWIWARPLNAAFALTHDERFSAAFDDLFQQWYDQRNNIERNIPDFDPVYYELGLGVRNRIFLEYYFFPYSKRTWQTHEKMLKTMLGAARWLYELELWEGYRSGNWQIHGSYMLAQIALSFPEFRESKMWLELSLKRLKEHLQEDFFEDGGHSERAPRNYTQATYVAYRNLYYLLTAHRIEEKFAQEIRQRMSRTIDWWMTMLTPTGEVPAINDSHRGQFPAFLLQDAAVFYKKPEVYGVLSQLLQIPAPNTSLQVPAFNSHNMASSGFAVMRTDWTRDALYMNINYGKWNGFHTHNDMLDFEIYAYGQALAIDAGIGLTYDDPLYIPWYKSSAAHNMVVVNNLNIEREKTEGKEITWYSSTTLDYFAGEHEGYASKGVHHRRSIAFVKPSYWIINDRLSHKNDNDTVSWYFHTPLHIERTAAGFSSKESPGFILLAFPSNVVVRQGEGMAASIQDVVPGKTQQIQWVAFDQISRSTQPTEFTILITPFRTERADFKLSAVSQGHFLVKTKSASDEVWTSPTSATNDVITTDAEFLLIHTGEGGVRHFSLVNGTYLKEGKSVVWKSSSRISAEGRMMSK